MKNKKNDEIELLKSEIQLLNKRIDDLENKVNNSQSLINSKINFEQYKKDVIEDDLEKIKQFKFYKWQYFLPLIGFFIYFYDLNLILVNTDRGFVRKYYTIYSIRYGLYMFIFTITCCFCIFNYFPFLDKKVFKKINQIWQKTKANNI